MNGDHAEELDLGRRISRAVKQDRRAWLEQLLEDSNWGAIKQYRASQKLQSRQSGHGQANASSAAASPKAGAQIVSSKHTSQAQT